VSDESENKYFRDHSPQIPSLKKWISFMSTHRQTDIATSTHTETKPNALPCIHIGLPKTATTTLQQYLFPRHPGLSYLGKYLSLIHI